MQYSDQDIEDITKIVEQLKREFPQRSLKRIVQDAERVYLNRKTHKPIKNSPPEHVLRNIERVKKADEERKEQGRSLPRVRFVKGGAAANNQSKIKKSTDKSYSHKSRSAGGGVEPILEEKVRFLESDDCGLSDEIDKSEVGIFREGSMRQVTVNAYERNPEARRKCIAYYGACCCICGFEFEKKYGEAGRGFIHVHHERPLATIGEEYEVDPVGDLKPVCPNCHAIIHRRKPAYTISEVKEMLRKQKI
jgi:hypothetical protein